MSLRKLLAFNAGFPASVKEVVLSGLTKTKKYFKDSIKVIIKSQKGIREIKYISFNK